MKYNNWNDIQELLFDKLLENDEGVALPQLIETLTPNKIIWQNFYDLLVKKCEYFNELSNVNSIKEIEYNDNLYLFINFSIDFIIIDMGNGMFISEEEFNSIFPNSIVDSFRCGRYYHIDECDDSQSILEYYKNNSEILLGDTSIYYEIKTYIGTVSICLELDRLNSTISFNLGKNVNYLFISSNLEATGVSNPTGNKESLKAMGLKTSNIVIPYEVIPDSVIIDKNTRKLEKNN